MKKIYLHVGADKAGSTAIQYAMYFDREFFHKRGVYVFSTGQTAAYGHVNLFSDLKADTWGVLQEELSAFRENPAVERGLFSFEGLHRRKAEYFAEVASRFGGLDVHVIYILREQAELVSSGVLQRIKQFDTKIDLLSIDAQLDSNAFDWSARDPMGQLRKFEPIFGRPNLHFVEYSKNALFADFFAAMETLDVEDVPDIGAANPSLTYEAALVLQGFRALGLERSALVKVRDALLDRCAELGGGREVFSDESVAWIRSKFAVPNEEFARTVFGRDLLFKTKRISRRGPPDPDRVQRYADAGAQALRQAVLKVLGPVL